MVPGEGELGFWSTQVDRDPISYQIILKHSLPDLKPIKGYSTFLWSKFPMIHLLKEVHDSLPPWSVCIVECWTLADKSRRNAGVSESVGRSGDLSLAGDGGVTMVMADTWSALWPLNNSRPEKWDVPICLMLNTLSTLCHYGQGGRKGQPLANKWKMLMGRILSGNERNTFIVMVQALLNKWDLCAVWFAIHVKSKKMKVYAW